MFFSMAITAIAFLSLMSPTFALTGAEHQKMIIECVFGSEYLHDTGARELVDFVSKGMDFGGGLKPLDFSQLGSSFLNTVKEKFPNFKGSHREFGHWSLDGDIPREVLQEFEKVYPGKRDEFTELWRQYVGTRRGGTRLAMGLSKEADRVAQSLASLQDSCHNLGDWTTADTKGLPPLKNIVRDVERSYHRILGNNNDAVAEFIGELKSVPDTLPTSERATRIGDIWRLNTKLNQATGNVLKRYGFSGRIRPIDCVTLSREVRPFTSSMSIKPTPKVNFGRAVSNAGRGAVRAGMRGVAKGVAKAGSRGMLSFLGKTAPVIVDVGFWIYGNYKIEDEYTRGLISETERIEKKVENAGGAIGGATGGLVGAGIGKQISDELGYEGGKAFALIAAGSVLAGYVGDWIGGNTAKKVYELVDRSPYEVCRDACNIGDVDAMFFNGLYHHEGRYVERNEELAQLWFKWAASQGDVRAQFYHGEYCYPKDASKAAFWWKLAADSNSSEAKFKECKAAAAYNLAGCYMTGMGLETNEARSIGYLIMARELGNKSADDDLRTLIAECKTEVGKPCPNPGALKILGNYYSFLGGDSNSKIAFEYTLKAAQLGDSSAINNLALAYEEGNNVEKNLSKALSLYHLAADMGQPVAVNNFIRLVNKLSIWDENIDWLVEKSNDGIPQASDQLARLAWTARTNDVIHALPPFRDTCESGLVSMAIRLFERAEGLGCDKSKWELVKFFEDKELRQHLTDSSAETFIHRLYELAFRNVIPAQLILARALEQNTQNASFYYALAAINGNAEAQYEFGRCCYAGCGIPKNYGKAVNWWHKAANQGHAEAWHRLALCYWNGEGVNKDKAKAEQCFRLAKKQVKDTLPLQGTDEFVKKIIKESWSMELKYESDLGLPIVGQIIFNVPNNAIDATSSHFTLVVGYNPYFGEKDFSEDRTKRSPTNGNEDSCTSIVFPIGGRNAKAFSSIQLTLVHEHPTKAYKVVLTTVNKLLDGETLRRGEDAVSHALHDKYPIRSRIFSEKWFLDTASKTFCFHSIETEKDTVKFPLDSQSLKARMKNNIKLRYNVDIDF